MVPINYLRRGTYQGKLDKQSSENGIILCHEYIHEVSKNASNSVWKFEYNTSASDLPFFPFLPILPVPMPMPISAAGDMPGKYLST